MNAAQKEILLKGWEDLENQAIVKDVATKGKFINLCLGFLAKRMNISTDVAKEYFNQEVNKYVKRLLSNKQVFKAEHVLKNVERNPKYIFYEFASTCGSDEVKDIILKHLRKLDAYFDQEIKELDENLLMLKLVQMDKTLSSKYNNEMNELSLENLYQKDLNFKDILLVDVVFQTKSLCGILKLNKYIVWNYLIDNKLFFYVVIWLDTLSQTKIEYLDEKPFEAKLKYVFAEWSLNEQMISDVNNYAKDLPESVLNSLARNGIFIEEEQNDIRKILERIFTTDSWKKNQNLIKSEKFMENLIEIIIDKNALPLLVENIVSMKSILDTLKNYPNKTNEIELCLAIKDADIQEIGDVAKVATKVSEYILHYDVEFYRNNPLVYLCEIFLKGNNVSSILASDESKDILYNIPLVKLFLHKLNTFTACNDHEATLDDLVKQFKNIDLRQIRQESGGEELNFSNKTLSLKYSNPTKLGYIHYIKQYRSAFAVYIFFVDQLQTYSQIAKGQILLACNVSGELAINHFNDKELVTHCISFIEMLGMNTSILRGFIKCMDLVAQSRTDNNDEDTITGMSENEILKQAEKAIELKLCENQFNPRDFDALTLVYNVRDIKLPNSILRYIASTSNWFRFVLFATYFNYPINQIIELCETSFGEGFIGKNLAKAIKYDNGENRCKRSSSLTYREHKKKIQNKMEILSVASGETMSSSVSSNEALIQSKLNPSKFLHPDEDTDLFATILLSTVESSAEELLTYTKFSEILNNPEINQPATYLNLLRNAVRMKWPILAVLSAILKQEYRDYCWIVWMMTSVDSYSIAEDINDLEDISRTIIEYCITNRYVQTLNQGIKIFYAENRFRLFTEYLARSSRYNFTPDTTELLQTYLIALSRDEVELSCFNNNKFDILNFSITMLVHHLNTGFDSSEHRQLLLQSLCDSGISDFINVIDFCLIKSINEIVSFTAIDINVELLMRDKYSDADIKNEYERICDQLVAAKEYDKAKAVADLLGFPKDNIIYENWAHSYENDINFDLNICETDIEIYSLAPQLVITFYSHVAEKLNYGNPKRYKILKKIMDVIKRHHLFPNECFDRDRIEYEMIISFLKNPQNVDDLDVYNSEYFETIMSKERFVLYKSFMDLKDMAGIDDLTVFNKKNLDQQEIAKLEALINRLLDQGDIVQALRIQAIFTHRPLDLHYLVFCMALAEGLATLYDLSADQRQMLNDGAKSALSYFNRRTLRSKRSSQTSNSSSPSKTGNMDSSDASGNLEFEEIPSREKQDVLEALQSLAARINHGSKIGHRIAMTSRAAMYLDKEYVDVLKTKDPYVLLQNAIDEDCLNKLVVMSDIMTSMEMSHKEIADFLAEKIATSVIKSRFYLLQNSPSSISHIQNTLWGYDLDKEFRMFLELCPNSSMLGNSLLTYCDCLKLYRKFDMDKNSEPDEEEKPEIKKIFKILKQIMENKLLSHKKQNTITVELLIKAHDCFVYECYMDGIAFVLQRAKVMNNVLANAKSWSLIVKMLFGIGRYRDMYYCFETLIKNDQFESLLGQFDEERINGLKQAIISYLHEHCPENSEYFRLAALHFMMYKEIAQMWENEAKSTIAKLISGHEINDDGATTSNRNQDESSFYINYLKCSSNVTALLNSAMDGYAHSAENYLLDNKLGFAQRAANNAELIALQINLMNKALDNNSPTCISVLNIRSGNLLRHIVNKELSVPQAMILSRAYPFEINWTDAIFNQYILFGNDNYLTDYCDRMELTERMIEVLVKNFQHQTNITKNMERCISTLVEMVESVSLRYKLASLLGLKRIIANLINDESVYYLKDTNYGRNEI